MDTIKVPIALNDRVGVSKTLYIRISKQLKVKKFVGSIFKEREITKFLDTFKEAVKSLNASDKTKADIQFTQYDTTYKKIVKDVYD